jgi:hypothetical protein
MSHPSKPHSEHRLSIREAAKVFLWPVVLVLVMLICGYFLYTRAVSARGTSASKVASPAGRKGQEAQPSWLLDFLHISLPLAVIALEFYMLLKMHKESRERLSTVADFQQLRKQFDREHYMQSIAMETSKTEKIARFTSRSMETSATDAQRIILDAVQQRLRDKPSYQHRGLLAKRQEVLPGAIDLMLRAHNTLPAPMMSATGASPSAARIDLRVSSVIAQSRLSFFVRDSEVSILGIGKGDPRLDEVRPTEESMRWESKLLAIALERQFDALWKNSEPLGVYIDQIISDADQTMDRDSLTPLSDRDVRRWFGKVADNENFDALLEEISKKYREMRIGATGSAHLADQMNPDPDQPTQDVASDKESHNS